MLSTFHKGSKADMIPVQSKFPNQHPTMKPVCVVDYTKHMGGVDRSDHFISSYQFMRKTVKWYRKMFFWLLEVSIVNSHILYNMVQTENGKKTMQHMKSRMCLVEALVYERMLSRRKMCSPGRGRPSIGSPEQRLSGLFHSMNRKQGSKGRCVVCLARGVRKETIYFCETCDLKPYLHPDNCFGVYHTQKDITVTP